MGKLPEFYVDADLCTECEDCYKLLPGIFRKVDGEEIAEVFNTDIDESQKPAVEKIMAECPGHAILWKK
jgi:ferredoxin